MIDTVRLIAWYMAIATAWFVYTTVALMVIYLAFAAIETGIERVWKAVRR